SGRHPERAGRPSCHCRDESGRPIRWCRPAPRPRSSCCIAPSAATWHIAHLGLPASECCQSLSSLDTDEGPDGLAEQLGLVHAGVGHFERLFVKLILDRNGGAHGGILSGVASTKML